MYTNLIGNIFASSLYKSIPYVLIILAGKFYANDDLSLFSTYINYLQLISAVGMYGLMYEYLNMGEINQRLRKFNIIKKIILVNFLIIISVSVILSLLFLNSNSGLEIFKVIIGLTAGVPIALYGIKVIDLIELKRFILAGIGSFGLLISSVFIIYHQLDANVYLSFVLIALVYWVHYFFINKYSNMGYHCVDFGFKKYIVHIKSSTPYFLSILVTPLSVVAINFVLLKYGGMVEQAKFSFNYSVFALLVFLPNSLVQFIIIKLRNKDTNKNLKKTINIMGIYFLIVSAILSIVILVILNSIGYGSRIDLDLAMYAGAASVFSLSLPLTQSLISNGKKLLVLKLNYLWLGGLLFTVFIISIFEIYNLGIIFLCSFIINYLVTRFYAFRLEEA